MIAIENLTRVEKLQMMEALWDDLSHDSALLDSPNWHENKLKEAEQAYAAGQANFVDWELAKKNILNR